MNDGMERSLTILHWGLGAYAFCQAVAIVCLVIALLTT